MDRDREYFEQLTAERKVTRFHKGFKRVEWEKSDHTRNEVFDCRVDAYATLCGVLAARFDLNSYAKGGVEKRSTERGITMDTPLDAARPLPP